MSDIFISYSEEDRERTEALAAAFTEQGWSVFWDRTVPAGLTWREFIGKELDDARCVLVAWSATSVKSHWVLEEAGIGRTRKILIPVLFEAVQPPSGFAALQASDLSDYALDTFSASTIIQYRTGATRLAGYRRPTAVSAAERPRRCCLSPVAEGGKDHVGHGPRTAH